MPAAACLTFGLAVVARRMVEPLLTPRPLHIARARVDHRLRAVDLAPEHPGPHQHDPEPPDGLERRPARPLVQAAHLGDGRLRGVDQRP